MKTEKKIDKRIIGIGIAGILLILLLVGGVAFLLLERSAATARTLE